MIVFFVGTRHFHTEKWIRALASKADSIVVLIDKPWENLPDNCRQFTYQAGSRHKLDLHRRANQSMLNELARSFKPDVTFLAWLNKFTGVLKYPKPLVFQSWGADLIRDRRFPTARQALLIPWILRQADLVWTSSEFHNQCVRRLTRYPERVVTVPFGVEDRLLDWDGEKTLVEHPIRLLFLKHLLPKYGPMDVVELSRRLDPQRYQFVLAGKGDLEREIRAALQKYRLYHVEMPGFVDRDCVFELLKSTHIMLSPSHYRSETLGVACIEAAAMGIPSVASRVGGLPYSVRDGETGLLFEVGGIDAMQRCVERLSNPNIYVAFSSKARRFARRYYRMRDIRDQWVFPMLQALAEKNNNVMTSIVQEVNQLYATLRL